MRPSGARTTCSSCVRCGVRIRSIALAASPTPPGSATARATSSRRCWCSVMSAGGVDSTPSFHRSGGVCAWAPPHPLHTATKTATNGGFSMFVRIRTSLACGHEVFRIPSGGSFDVGLRQLPTRVHDSFHCYPGESGRRQARAAHDISRFRDTSRGPASPGISSRTTARARGSPAENRGAALGFYDRMPSCSWRVSPPSCGPWRPSGFSRAIFL